MAIAFNDVAILPVVCLKVLSTIIRVNKTPFSSNDFRAVENFFSFKLLFSPWLSAMAFDLLDLGNLRVPGAQFYQKILACLEPK